jgi:hypothetical protein
MKKKKKIIFIYILIIIIIMVLLSPFLFYKWLYPYGERTISLLTIQDALEAYAEDNNGYFPSGGKTPLKSLQKLYPKYRGLPDYFAGLSGDIELTNRTLRSGGELDNTMSSWVYWQGFHIDDNPNLAVIWERRDGIAYNGTRTQKGSHSVGFIDGTKKQIYDWDKFAKKQKKLREEVLKNRKNNRIENKENAQDSLQSP